MLTAMTETNAHTIIATPAPEFVLLLICLQVHPVALDGSVMVLEIVLNAFIIRIVRMTAISVLLSSAARKQMPVLPRITVTDMTVDILVLSGVNAELYIVLLTGNPVIVRIGAAAAEPARCTAHIRSYRNVPTPAIISPEPVIAVRKQAFVSIVMLPAFSAMKSMELCPDPVK